jgi:rhodanese-related sulfurtransferase
VGGQQRVALGDKEGVPGGHHHRPPGVGAGGLSKDAASIENQPSINAALIDGVLWICRQGEIDLPPPTSTGERYAPPMSSTRHSSEIEVEPARVAEWLAEDPRVQVVDVREPYEREAGHIAGSVHVELGQLPARADAVDRARPVVFYCRVGSRSLMAAQAFRASGYQAYSMEGGLLRWAQEDRPLAPAGGRVAEH